MSLEELLDNKYCDKNRCNINGHSYGKTYSELLEPIRNLANNVMEIGIAHGGSIKLWHDYFLNATIYGLDIINYHSDWNQTKIIKNPRIKLLTNTNAYDNNFINNNFPNIKFDMILDDGPHTLESMIFSAKYYTDLLTEKGILIIEDVQSIDWITDIYNAVPDNLKCYCKTYDLRNNYGRYDDIIFVINKNF